MNRSKRSERLQEIIDMLKKHFEENPLDIDNCYAGLEVRDDEDYVVDLIGNIYHDYNMVRVELKLVENLLETYFEEPRGTQTKFAYIEGTDNGGDSVDFYPYGIDRNECFLYLITYDDFEADDEEEEEEEENEE